MKTRDVLFSALMFLMAGASAQSGGKQVNLQFTIKGVENDTVYLIRYYGDKMYYADTARSDAKGTVRFKSKFAAEAGMYAVMPKDKSGYFEVILNNEDVYIETEKGAFVPKMKVVKSKENQEFYKYINFITERQKFAEPLKKQLDEAKDEAQKKKIRSEMERLDKEVKHEQIRIMNDNPGSVVALVMRLSSDIDVPEPPRDRNGKILDSLFQRNYYVSHFWDGINTGDERLIRISGYQKKLEYFFDKVLPQLSDSIIPHADKVVEKSKVGTEIYKFNVVWITSHFQNSKIMCLDKVFVHMVLKHYKSGQATWMTETKNKEIVERAESMAQVVCGNIAHNIILPDTTQDNWVALNSLKTKYRILVFWDPDCGHCKKEIPKMIENYETWKSMNAEVYSVSSKNNEEWRKFVKEKKIPFINVAVPKKVYEDQEYVNKIVLSGITDLKSLNYHNTFDIFKTPTVFIINEAGEIIGKNLESDGISDFLKRLNQMK